MKWISILVFLFSLSAFAQKTEDSKKHTDPADQNSKNVDQTEAVLHSRLLGLSERLKNHTKLFKTRLEYLPAKTVVTKGVYDESEKDGDCKPALKKDASGKDSEEIDYTKQLDAANNCIKIEVFDFHRSEEGKSELNLGARSKYLILVYGKSGWGEDPKEEAPADLKFIKSKVIANIFVPTDLKISEVLDTTPHEQDRVKHDDSIVIFYQKDGLPMRGEKGKAPEEQKNKKGYGKYKLGYVENTKTYPTRNTFKQTYYLKHLDQFDKLLTAVFDTNDRYAGKRYKESNQILKESLVY
jgi:hypothetical protein